MKNKLVITLIIALCLLFTGCKSENPESATTEETAASTTQAATTEAYKETTEATVSLTVPVETAEPSIAQTTEPAPVVTEPQTPTTSAPETTPATTEAPLDFEDFIPGENETPIA